MDNITLEDLTHKLGNYKKIGDEFVWMCPYCNDVNGKDNMRYNPKKGVLWCFADDTHAPQILSEIMKEKQPPPPIEGIPQWKLEQEAYLEYVQKCYEDLLSNEKAYNYLENNKMINYDTILCCKIGYDFEDNKWVFPVYRYFDNQLVGFEYRPADFKGKPKCWKEKDTPSCLSVVYQGNNPEIMYICEGFIDSYILSQWMGFPDNVIIVTPSNGVGSIENCILEITFSNYKEIRLCLDNDDKSQPHVKNLLTKYPFMVDKTPQPAEGKDISDLYRELVYEQT